ncbi:ceramidase domain-containing protein [Pseudooceanicola sp.]|uniref:ceramidase domain-containing protein n=1 Tax=Pseudooceanicola sp. TaxID=1914328 RepID=UPI002624BB6D|nr:ceramidase domain-containing protein [Pseudooceanicola sp.]MDF1855095.1 hypothetical protein [Pseudooceanicola sp.]
MDWTRAVDGYCERLGPAYWAEPLNAVTNLAFLAAALLMWHRCAGLVSGRVLAAILFAIGIGSWLFHTHAQPWAGVADVAPIGIFIIAYIFVVNRDFLRLPGWQAGLGTVFSATLIPLLAYQFGKYELTAASAGYVPVPILLFGYGWALRQRLPVVARGLWIGAGLLVVSITLRSLDQPLCGVWPLGTHFLWHLLNAALLGWLIEVWRRHAVAA